jgi:hypothetical protein
VSARGIADRWKASGVFSPDALADPAVRRAVYEIIAAEDVRAYHGLLRAMLAMEAAYRTGEGAAASDGGDYYDNLYACGLLLYEIGDVSDVPAMWAAKMTNMDTGAGFDVQMLVGAGVDETLTFLREQGHSKAATYIEGCQSGGEFDELADWRTFARSFYLGPKG